MQNRGNWQFKGILGGVFLTLLLILVSVLGYCQYDAHYDTDHLSTITFGPESGNGFRISVSLVAMFTTGTSVLDGFRLGGGVYLSQTIGDWTVSTGFDAYKAKQSLGLGTLFAGVLYYDGKYGGMYNLSKYFQGDQQFSGILGLNLNDFQIRFEDDILAFPFVGLKIYDRYRSAALELRYKGFILGTNVYTTDINGMTDFSSNNPRGVYVNGKQVSSPVYVGYTTNDLILRYGINSDAGGWIGQNAWHQYFFKTPDFKSGTYKKQFLQVGVDKPYTLY